MLQLELVVDFDNYTTKELDERYEQLVEALKKGVEEDGIKFKLRVFTIDENDSNKRKVLKYDRG